MRLCLFVFFFSKVHERMERSLVSSLCLKNKARLLDCLIALKPGFAGYKDSAIQALDYPQVVDSGEGTSGGQ